MSDLPNQPPKEEGVDFRHYEAEAPAAPVSAPGQAPAVVETASRSVSKTTIIVVVVIAIILIVLLALKLSNGSSTAKIQAPAGYKVIQPPNAPPRLEK